LKPPRLGKGAAIAIAATLMLTLAAAGCGSSSSSSSSSTTAAVTKASFLAKANTICTKGNKEQAAASAKLQKQQKNIQTQQKSNAAFAVFVHGTLVPNVQGQIDAIRALAVPAADQATVTHLLNIAQADLNKVKANPTASLSGKTNPFANFAKPAHAFGLKACASNS
jgi:hypothetical protein